MRRTQRIENPSLPEGAEYADALRNDCFQPDSLFTPYVVVCCNATMYEDRRFAVDFLTEAMACMPESAGDLLKAGECYTQIKGLMEYLKLFIPEDDFSPKGMAVMADGAIRTRHADVILRMRDLESEAAGFLQKII